MTINKLPVLLMVSLGLLAGSFPLFLAGYSSNYWFSSSLANFGLWNYCSGVNCITLEQVVLRVPVHVYIARILCSVSLITLIVSGVLFALFVVHARHQKWLKIAYILALVTGTNALSGAITYIAADSSSTPVSWSGIVVILASLMQISSYVAAFVSVRQGQVTFVPV